jgi:CheY-like chemotaxis protein
MINDVLLVDDSPDLRFIWGAMLASAGLRGIDATTHTDALAIARATPLCGAVIDAPLRDGDGWRLAAALLADPRTAGIPIIMLDEYPAAHAVLPRNVARVLRKPIEPRELLEAVRAWCLPRSGSVERGA